MTEAATTSSPTTLTPLQWAAKRIHALLDRKQQSNEMSLPEDIDLNRLDAAFPRLSHLQRALGLMQVEVDLILLALAPEVDAELALHLSESLPSSQGLPTYRYAEWLFDGFDFSLRTSSSCHRYWECMTIGTGAYQADSTLRLDQCIRDWLLGADYEDPLLKPYIEQLASSIELNSVVLQAVQAIEERLFQSKGFTQFPPVLLHPSDGASSLSPGLVAAHLAHKNGLEAWKLHTSELPPEPALRLHLQHRWHRHALLRPSLLLLEPCGQSLADGRDVWLQRSHGITVTYALPVQKIPRRHIIEYALPQPEFKERLDTAKKWLGAKADGLNGELESALFQFRLNDSTLNRALTSEPLSLTPQLVGDALWQRLREVSRFNLEPLALRVHSKARWKDLILPQKSAKRLREITMQLKQRHIVHERWRFGAQTSRGHGVTALFAGPSGTGKTLAAEIIANELSLDLYRIDLSAVVSKYIGETESNLERVFRAAEQSGCVLFFDEADALFGKRNEVRDSHDRYANIEVSYLLQRMEQYHGLAILTTNLRDHIDQAFLRRIRFIIDFPFPNQADRARIWAQAYPAQTPTEELDFDRLSRLSLSGGQIHNIALNAAFFAAEANSPVTMKFIARATESELEKQGQAMDTSLLLTPDQR